MIHSFRLQPSSVAWSLRACSILFLCISLALFLELDRHGNFCLYLYPQRIHFVLAYSRIAKVGDSDFYPYGYSKYLFSMWSERLGISVGRLTEVVCVLEFSITVLVSTTGIERGLTHSMDRHFSLQAKNTKWQKSKSDLVVILIDLVTLWTSNYLSKFQIINLLQSSQKGGK